MAIRDFDREVDMVTPLTEIPQGCSSKFLTLGRFWMLVVSSFGLPFAVLGLVGSEPVGVAFDVEYHALV